MSAILQLDQMTLEEKLRTMDALWEDLCRQPEALSVPQWQNDLLEARERIEQEHLRLQTSGT